MKPSLHISYALKKRAKKMAKGGEIPEKKMGLPMAEGGDVEMDAHECTGPECMDESHDMDINAKDNAQPTDDELDMIGRIMKKRMMSKGGMVANSDEPIADDMPNEFDDLHLRDTLTAPNSGDDNGDELGNDQLDKDDSDIISRIMRSRAKKDRNPRPA